MTCAIKIFKSPEDETVIEYATVTCPLGNDFIIEIVKGEKDPWRSLYREIKTYLQKQNRMDSDALVYTALAVALCHTLPFAFIPPEVVLALRSPYPYLSVAQPTHPSIYQHAFGVETVDDLKIQTALQRHGFSTVYGMNGKGFLVDYYKMREIGERYRDYKDVLEKSRRWIVVPDEIRARCASAFPDLPPSLMPVPLNAQVQALEETFREERLTRLTSTQIYG